MEPQGDVRHPHVIPIQRPCLSPIWGFLSGTQEGEGGAGSLRIVSRIFQKFERTNKLAGELTGVLGHGRTK